MRIDRRTFVGSLVGTAIFLDRCYARDEHNLRDRIEGLLIGSMIGDAAGGPVEFRRPEEMTDWLPATRTWEHDRNLDADEIQQLASTFRLLSYRELRPKPSAYAHWTKDARPGTITDDSRHKIILMNALRDAQAKNAFPISKQELAQAYLDFAGTGPIRKRSDYAELCRESLAEFNQAARWILGHRENAAPVERLWGGVGTCAGQMTLLPLATACAGKPEIADRAAYAIDFLDNGPAKDINAAIVAGLAPALVETDSDPSKRWQNVIATMNRTDPFRYAEIKFVGRELNKWIDLAETAVRDADGKPKVLFRTLEQKGRPKYYWDAHFTFVSALAMIHSCQADPLASMHLAVDFGHDTDSSAQLVGAFVGAMNGATVFPEAMRRQVSDRLQADYDEAIDDWVSLLLTLNDRQRFPSLVRAS